MIAVWMIEEGRRRFVVRDSTGKVHLRSVSAQAALLCLRRVAKRPGYEEGFVIAEPSTLEINRNVPK